MNNEQLWRIGAVSAIVFIAMSVAARAGLWIAVDCIGCAVWGWNLGRDWK